MVTEHQAVAIVHAANHLWGRRLSYQVPLDLDVWYVYVCANRTSLNSSLCKNHTYKVDLDHEARHNAMQDVPCPESSLSSAYTRNVPPQSADSAGVSTNRLFSQKNCNSRGCCKVSLIFHTTRVPSAMK